MKKLKLLTALTMGIMASASGVLQVEAATYNFFVDFSTKEVADFNDFRQTFSTETYDLGARITFSYAFTYRFDSCPTAFEINSAWQTSYRFNGTGTSFILAEQELPNLPCTTTNSTYLVEVSTPLPNAAIDYLVDDDTDFLRFGASMIFRSSAAANGRTMTILGYRNFFNVEYDFNTTYLFNNFLSDQSFVSRTTAAGTGGLWTLTATQRVKLQYLYTTAGSDEYVVLNTNSTDIGTTRKKYAVDYNNEFFRGESVGAQFDVAYTGSDTLRFGSTTASISWQYNYYYLNTANLAQAIVDAPTLNFTEEDCGDFLSLNVGCFINNAFAYIVNDAPIISDAFTLLNAGIEMASQTFGIIGNFADDNVFGVLILAGFGFIAVKWFLKND